MNFLNPQRFDGWDEQSLKNYIDTLEGHYLNFLFDLELALPTRTCQGTDCHGNDKSVDTCLVCLHIEGEHGVGCWAGKIEAAIRKYHNLYPKAEPKFPKKLRDDIYSGKD